MHGMSPPPQSTSIVHLEDATRDAAKLRALTQAVLEQHRHVFLCIYMHGCGACEATMPQWNRMARELLPRSPWFRQHKKDIFVASLNEALLPHLPWIDADSVHGYPTIVHFRPSSTGRQGTIRIQPRDEYDQSPQANNARTAESLLAWIQAHTPSSHSSSPSPSRKRHSGGRATVHRRGKRRWSVKYKRSIRCSRPRGFSQRQYCRFGRRPSRTHHRTRRAAAAAAAASAAVA